MRLIPLLCIAVVGIAQTWMLIDLGHWIEAVFFGLLVPMAGIFFWRQAAATPGAGRFAWMAPAGVVLTQLAVFVFGLLPFTR